MSVALDARFSSSPSKIPQLFIGAAHRSAPLLVVCALCGLLCFYGLEQGDFYQTEGLRALVGAECFRKGTCIVPRLYGEPLLTKPPGMYAAMALVSWPAGRVTERTARLPSALAASITMLLFYWTFSRLQGRRAGLVAAALLPASLVWLNRAPSAEIDMLQLAWISAALLCGLRALEVTEARCEAWREWFWWQLALFCVAGGFLTKWTAPAFFYATAVPLLCWRGKLHWLFRWSHLVSLAIACLPCLWWVSAVSAEVGWPVLYETVRREALQHLSPLHHGRPYPWTEILTFPLVFLATLLPWSAVALLAAQPRFGRLWDGNTRRLWQMLCCWALANLLFWALVPGHRPRHSMPLQPAVAGLAALVWIAWLRRLHHWPIGWLRPGSVLAGLIVCWLIVKLVFVNYVVPLRDVSRQPRQRGERMAQMVPRDQMLYLMGLKDENMLFYYGRPARRLADLDRLPRVDRPAFCALTAEEWQHWPEERPATVVCQMHDTQGSPVLVVRTP